MLPSSNQIRNRNHSRKVKPRYNDNDVDDGLLPLVLLQQLKWWVDDGEFLPCGSWLAGMLDKSSPNSKVTHEFTSVFLSG